MSRRNRSGKRRSRGQQPAPERRGHSARRSRQLAVAVLLLLGVLAVAHLVCEPGGRVQGFEMIRELPHDPKAFTQGLVYHYGFLYESTGLHGESSLRKTDPKTGKVLQHHLLPKERFGEGITLVGDRLAQLTWRSGIGYVRDRETFRTLREFHYEGEGWGLAYDGSRLIMSDGTATLRFLDPETFQVIGRLLVTERDRPVAYLNELEVVEDEIYANVWESDRIARISPDSGQVLGWIDMGGLRARAARAAPTGHELGVLNGIAYDAEGKRLFVTGKLWPLTFEIRLTQRE